MRLHTQKPEKEFLSLPCAGHLDEIVNIQGQLSLHPKHVCIHISKADGEYSGQQLQMNRLRQPQFHRWLCGWMFNSKAVITAHIAGTESEPGIGCSSCRRLYLASRSFLGSNTKLQKRAYWWEAQTGMDALL